jgi:phage tail sheath gpL-like
MPQAIVIVEAHVDGVTAADLAKRVAVPAAKPREEVAALAAFFGGELAKSNAEVSVRVDVATGVAAARTLTITGASVAAAEWIGFWTPQGTWRVTGVTSGAASGDGTFNVSATDNTAATNIRAAINSLPGLKDVVTASGATNSVIITANVVGSLGNTIRIVDGTGGAIGTVGLLTGGLDPTERVTGTIGCVLANTDADDTVSIGRTTFTAKASGASGDNEFNLGASDTAMGDNLVAKINAHPDLLGIVSGINASGTITLTYHCDPRVALHIRLATSDADGLVITQPSSSLTLTNAQATRLYAMGAA